MLSFTGSTRVGRLVSQAASERVLRVALEPGGNAPFVVLDPCGLDRCISGVMLAKMRHSAQTCTAANRFIVSDPAAPFGGMRQSGLGREGGAEGIYEFCETQYLAHAELVMAPGALSAT